ncbi:MAG TPA: PAS domain S-box protein [Bacteroidales bacterium]|nr:PAS domain S-box protein [Bacteroidales bacterium]HSA44364.1 PAS domain S-box protein [Bacteroidales bacterium]
MTSKYQIMKNILSLLSLFLLAATQLFPQETRAPQWHTLVSGLSEMIREHKQEDSIRKALGRLDIALWDAPADTALSVCRKLMEDLDSNRYPSLTSDLYYMLNKAYADKGLTGKSLEMLLNSFRLLSEKGLHYNSGYVLIDIGNRFYASGLYHISLNFYREANHIFNKIGARIGNYTANNNLGLSYREMENPDSALFYFRQAERILIENSEFDDKLYLKGHSLAYIASIYYIKKRYNESISYCRRAIDQINADTNRLFNSDHKRTITALLYQIGLCYKELKQESLMLQYFQRATILAKQYRAYRNLFQINLNLCRHFNEAREYGLALLYAKTALDCADSTYVGKDKAEAVYCLALNNLALNNTVAARHYLGMFKKLNDSLETLDATRKLTEIQTAFDAVRSNRENERLKEQQKQYWSWAIAMAILILLTITFLLIYQGIRRKNEQRLKVLSNATFEGILIHDRGIILDTNEKAIEIFGMKPGQKLKGNIFDLIPPEHHSMVLEKIRADQDEQYTIPIKTGSGSIAVVEVLSRPFVYKGRQVRIAAIRDISEQLLANRRLRESEEKYRLLADNMTDILWQLDQDLVFLYISPSVHAILGYTPYEVTGKPISHFLPERSTRILEIFRNRYTSTLHRNLPLLKNIIEIQIRHKDGRLLWFENHISPVLEEDGSLQFFQGITHNINLRKELQQSLQERERTLTTLMANLPGIAYRCKNDKNWTMEFVSKGCLELTGYPPDALVNNKIISYNDLIEPEYREYLWEIWQEKLKTQDFFESEYPIITSNGDRKWVWEKGCGVFDKEGRLIALEGFITDITSKKYFEEYIKNKNAELEEANATKTRFFSIIGHDLKNPLHAILGFSQLLYDEYENYSDEERRQTIRNIRDVSLSLQKLLQNLLEWSQAHSGKIAFTLEKAYLNLLVRETLSLLSEHAAAKEVSIISHIPADLQVYADRNMISTVLRNILSNSIKFSFPGSRVEISARVQGNFTEIMVRDYGTGMDPEEIQQLFDISRKIKRDGTLKEKGTGLGLVICKEFVEKHRGSIQVESTPGEGTTFTFTIPGAG